MLYSLLKGAGHKLSLPSRGCTAIARRENATRSLSSSRLIGKTTDASVSRVNTNTVHRESPNRYSMSTSSLESLAAISRRLDVAAEMVFAYARSDSRYRETGAAPDDRNSTIWRARNLSLVENASSVSPRECSTIERLTYVDHLSSRNPYFLSVRIILDADRSAIRRKID